MGNSSCPVVEAAVSFNSFPPLSCFPRSLSVSEADSVFSSHVDGQADPIPFLSDGNLVFKGEQAFEDGTVESSSGVSSSS